MRLKSFRDGNRYLFNIVIFNTLSNRSLDLTSLTTQLLKLQQFLIEQGTVKEKIE